MKNKIKAIVLGRIKHSEKSDIITLYSLEAGRIVALTPARVSRSRRTSSSLLFPLCMIESEININPTLELQKLNTFSIIRSWHNIYFHPVKNAMALFISEFLNRLLRESIPDNPLWNFIVNSISLLDSMTENDGLACFHLAFCISLLGFAGIMPDVSNSSDKPFFDMRYASYTDLRPMHKDVIGGRYAHIPALIARMNFRNMKLFRLSKQQRDRILDGILYYYAIHLPGFDSMKSPKVLKELF